jgi:hypothetical protein
MCLKHKQNGYVIDTICVFSSQFSAAMYVIFICRYMLNLHCYKKTATFYLYKR